MNLGPKSSESNSRIKCAPTVGDPRGQSPLAFRAPHAGPTQCPAIQCLTLAGARGLIRATPRIGKFSRMALKSHSAKAPANGLIENIKTLLYAGLIAVGVRTVAFEPFNIPSGSMIPTLLIGDYVFVSKYSYGYSKFSMPFSPPLFSGRIFSTMPKRGDVAVFRQTHDTSIDYVKRVIGLPGDKVQVKAGQLYLNGTLVVRDAVGDYEADDENGTHILAKEYIEHLPAGPTHHLLKYGDEEHYDAANEIDPNNTPEYLVPEGHLFMMGDNRDNSLDSRFMASGLGFVPMENLVGRAEFVFFSIDSQNPVWQFWYWPMEIRWTRLLHVLH